MLKNKLRDDMGNMLPFVAIMVLGLLIVFTGITEYMRLQIIAKGVRDAIESAVISVSVENYENVYSPLRESYSGGYKLKNDNWKEVIDSGDVYKELSELLGLEKQEKYYVKKAGESYEYKLSNLEVRVINSSLAPIKNKHKFSAESFINLEVPLSFGWEHLSPMKIRLKVKSEYAAKF
ncbi:hypothetical protein [Xylanivirga thermophila]|uniref:hypothetical protein n=1 Tax=Xylanivirga thermophila TaxID=2496273 RepID=UPI0037421599